MPPGSGSDSWNQACEVQIPKKYLRIHETALTLASLFCYDAMQPLFCCIYLRKNYSVNVRVNTSKLRNISDYALHNRAHAGGVSLFNISVLEQLLNTCALTTYCMLRNLFLKVWRKNYGICYSITQCFSLNWFTCWLRYLLQYVKLVGFGRACAPVRCAHPSNWAY